MDRRIVLTHDPVNRAPPQQPGSAGKPPDQSSPKTDSSSNAANTSPGVSWIAVYTRLANDIPGPALFSENLESLYTVGAALTNIHSKQDPESLSSADVKEFLTSLAVDRKVSASTQNQAFNARLFFYRHVLN